MTTASLACGISWDKPNFHFDSINEKGRVSYWTDVGTIKLDDEHIPILINFLSDKKSSSPYLGSGWTIPILEARMEQTNENTFLLWQPNGRYRTFRRDKKNPNILNGSGGWKAEISGDEITAYADCGWKISMIKGRISSIETPKSKKYQYHYEGGLVKWIGKSGGSNPLIKVVRDASNTNITKLVLDGNEIVFKQGDRPRVENINGQNLITDIDKSLLEFSNNEEKNKKEKYSYHPSRDNIAAIFDVNHQRSFTWNTETGIVVSENDWKYTVKPSKEEWNYSSVFRLNSEGTKESWSKDVVKGIEVVSKNNTTVEKHFFASGKLYGRLRKKISRTDSSEEIEVYSYDSIGRLLRLRESDYIWEFKYDGNQLIAYTKK